MPKFMLIPGVIAGFVLWIVFIALTALKGLDYGTRETIAIAVMAIVVLAAQAVAARATDALVKPPQSPDSAPAFMGRYFTAMLTGAIAAVAYGIFMWIHFTFVDASYLDGFYQEYLQRAREAATPEKAEAVLTAAERMRDFITDPFSQAMVQFGTTLMIGLLTGLLIAAFRKPR